MGQIELLIICILNHLTVCNEMIDMKLNNKYYLATLEAVYQGSKEWIISNRIINVR